MDLKKGKILETSMATNGKYLENDKFVEEFFTTKIVKIE